jgi:hypothetical protein
VVDSSSDKDSAVPSEKTSTPIGPSEDPPGRLGKFWQAQGGENSRWGTRKKEVSSKVM